METLFLTHDSPVPTQITLEFVGSIVTAPIDCALVLSNTGLKVVPPFTDFHTPPLAAPAKTVSRPWSCTASTAAIRPLMTADPILRAGRPEIVAESNFTGCCAMALMAKAAHVKTQVMPFRHARPQLFVAVTILFGPLVFGENCKEIVREAQVLLC